MSTLLSDRWTVDVVGGTVRLYIVTKHDNVAVSKAIVWSTTSTQIFVHNKPLPADHALFDSKAPNESDEDICSYLKHLAFVLQHAAVCKGIIHHEDMWKQNVESGKGTIEKAIFEDYKCMRSSNCALILVDPISKCESCKNLQSAMKNQAIRKRKSKSQKTTNNRYLDRQQLDAKAVAIQIEKRALEKKMAKLEKRIAKEIEKNSINISSDLSEDLGKVFERHHAHLTPVEKLFWSQQLKALSVREKNPRCMRWHPFIIRLALTIQARAGSSGYKGLRTFLQLPSERTLYDYTHYVDAEPGIQHETLQRLSEQVEKLTEGHEEYFSCTFDEVHVKGGVVIDKKTGEVIGYTHLSEVEEEMKKLEADMAGVQFDKVPAKSVLMFLAQGITTNLQGIVGIYPARDMTAGQLFTRAWNIIYSMESYNLKLLALIGDGAATNKKFFRMHPPLPPGVIPKLDEFPTDVVYATVNLASSEKRPLFFIIDPPHLLKTLRNCLANSYGHKKTRKMYKNGEDLSWEVIVKLYEHTILDKFKTNKLTKAHVKLTAFSCMKVLPAAQTMSRSVPTEIAELAERSSVLQGHDTFELCQFIRHVNDAFDCFNSSGDAQGKRNKLNPLLASYTSVDDTRFNYLLKDMLGFFKKWEADVKKRKGKFTKDAREKMFISTQSYESLKVTTYGFIGTITYMLDQVKAPKVDGRKLNQDKLEQTFGNLRMSGGGNRSLNVAEIGQKCINLEVQGRAALPTKRGNTEVLEESWEPDDTPLKKRRKT